MKTVIIALLFSILLLVGASPVASAFASRETIAMVVAVDASTATLPIWGYGVLAVNLLIAGLLAAFPFIARK